MFETTVKTDELFQNALSHWTDEEELKPLKNATKQQRAKYSKWKLTSEGTFAICPHIPQ